ncbi:MAG TPA: LapA family protein [Bradyrhizobium sp.]|nr:LapA family protein [Bradyrhizobium sp.]
MRKFFTALIVIPLGLLFVVFAVANRHFVTVSFDPFNTRDPSVGVTMPLFAVIIVVAILGVVAGGTASWFRQRHWRRAARQHEADARQAQAQLAELRARAMTFSRGDSRFLALPPQGTGQGTGYGAAGRDKHGATL